MGWGYNASERGKGIEVNKKPYIYPKDKATFNGIFHKCLCRSVNAFTYMLFVKYISSSDLNDKCLGHISIKMSQPKMRSSLNVALISSIILMATFCSRLRDYLYRRLCAAY